MDKVDFVDLNLVTSWYFGSFVALYSIVDVSLFWSKMSTFFNKMFAGLHLFSCLIMHMQILHIKTFLYNMKEPRYWDQNFIHKTWKCWLYKTWRSQARIEVQPLYIYPLSINTVFHINMFISVMKSLWLDISVPFNHTEKIL